MKPSRRTLPTDLLFGVVLGAVVSILPLPINVVAALVLVVMRMIFRKYRQVPVSWSNSFVVSATVLGTVLVAMALPVKQLDGVVPPLRYGRMPLAQLCDALVKDHRIFVRPEYQTNAKMIVTFSTDRAMTKKKVLQKLAEDTGTELHIGYCGTGANLLFGAHPSFTRLRGVGRKPGA